MIQCVQGKIDNPIVLALLEPDNFHDFVGHHFPQIAKRTGYKAEKIIKAAQFLATLNPKPRSAVFIDPAPIHHPRCHGEKDRWRL